jgi:anti-sigma B factor antagonist
MPPPGEAWQGSKLISCKDMSLEIQEREREGILILDLNGRITSGAEAGSFREAASAVATRPSPNLILNMANVDYVDSTGLGAMVMIATSVKRSGGKVKLLTMNRRNIELLVMTKLATIFEIFNDELDAINSFFPDRAIKTFDILAFVKEHEND